MFDYDGVLAELYVHGAAPDGGVSRLDTASSGGGEAGEAPPTSVATGAPGA